MPYQTKSQWTIDELKKLNKATLIGMHKMYLALIIVLEVIFAGGFIVSAAISSVRLMIEFAVLFIILPLSLYLITNIRITKEYNSNKLLQSTVTTFSFYDDKFESASDRGNSFVKYDELYKILETDTNFYLFLSKNQALNVIKANCSDELISFLHDLKSEKKTYDKENLRPVIKTSICSGEKVAGFKNIHTGAFEEVMLIRGDEDLAKFKKKYGIDGEIEKIY